MRLTSRNRALAAAVAVAAAVALAACGSSSSGTSSKSTTPATATIGHASPAPAASGPGVGKPPVTIGDKNFTEEYILGSLYAQALAAKGYKVTVKGNIGSSEITYKALQSGQIDMYPEYTGVILSVLAGETRRPTSEDAAYAAAQKFALSKGFILLKKTPFFDADAMATLKPFAQKYQLATLGDLKKLNFNFSLGAPPENKTRYEGLVGMRDAYGITNVKFVPLTIGLQYQALNSGNVQTANVFTTDGQLTSGKYVILTDTKHIYGFQNVAPVIPQKLLSGSAGTQIAQISNKVSSLLTIKAMRAMDKAAYVQKATPKQIANGFLKANGLK